MPVFMELTFAKSQAVVKKRALTSKRGMRVQKSRTVDKLVELTGWPRDYARATLRHALNPPPPKPWTGWRPTYGTDLILGLVLCWSVWPGSPERVWPIMSRQVGVYPNGRHPAR